MKTISLTAHELPRKTEAWPKCPECGEFMLPHMEAPCKFSEGTSFPVSHEYRGTITVFRDAAQVSEYVDRAVGLLGKHPLPQVDFRALFQKLISERSVDMNQLLHAVHEFEGMLRVLFGRREEIHDDAVVWAFAYIMHLVAGGDSLDTDRVIHGYWERAMFDSAERARGIRDAVINN